MQGCAHKCLKFIVFLLNFIIFLCGVGLIVVGAFLATGFTEWIPIEEVANLLQNELLRTGAYIIIAAGCFVTLVSALGCCGACLENKCLLGLYFAFLLIIFCAQLAAGILAAIYSAEITSFLSNEGTDFLKRNYNNTNNGTSDADNYANEVATAAWDVVQQQYRCCGVLGPADYSGNPYITDTVPPSCRPTGGNTNAPFDTGCQDSLENLLEMYATVIGATAIGVACLELFCMVFAVCLCRNAGQED